MTDIIKQFLSFFGANMFVSPRIKDNYSIYTCVQVKQLYSVGVKMTRFITLLLQHNEANKTVFFSFGPECLSHSLHLSLCTLDLHMHC